MKRLKLIWFALAGTFFLALLLCLLVIESVPLFIYYLVKGKPAGISEKLTAKTFSFIEERFSTISDYAYEGHSK